MSVEVYIKGMEMPTRCGRCDMRIPAYDDGIFDHYECCITAAIIDNLGEKMEDCPLVPVPEHGDLIDRDAARGSIKPWSPEDERAGCTFDTVKKLMHTLLNKAPTIIPAEEGEV